MQRAVTEPSPTSGTTEEPPVAIGTGELPRAQDDVKHRHHQSAGEKKFNWWTYGGIGYGLNALLSIAAVYWVERRETGQKFVNAIAKGIERLKVKPDSAKFFATKSFFLAGGFILIPFIKWLEDYKPQIVKRWNHQIYGDKADIDPKLVQSQKELDETPKQGWSSVITGRFMSLVPFYLTLGLLWQKNSLLSKFTNPEFRKMSWKEMRALEKADVSQFAQMASKGVYIEKYLANAARWCGKQVASWRGNTAAVAKIEEMAQKYPGMIKEGPVKALEQKAGESLNRDPLHSSLFHTSFSEASLCMMVAIGLYIATRITGPFFGNRREEKKHRKEETRESAMQRMPDMVSAADESGSTPKPQTPIVAQPTTNISLAGVQHQAAAQTAASRATT